MELVQKLGSGDIQIYQTIIWFGEVTLLVAKVVYTFQIQTFIWVGLARVLELILTLMEPVSYTH